ncbi:MAG: PEP-CTERM sorting domain-containing protein [Planctomycetota bacterium]
MRTFSIIAATAAALLSAQAASAQLIAADSFDSAVYDTDEIRFDETGPNNDGDIVTTGWSGGTPWVSGTGNLTWNSISLGNGGVSYDDASDGKGRYIANSFDFFRQSFHNLDSYTPADTYFMSFFVDPGGSFLSSGSREYATVGFTNAVTSASFNNTSADNVFGLQVGFRGEDAGADADTTDLIIRARDLSGDLADTVLVADAGNEPFGGTFHVLMKVDINVGGGTADDVTYWVNPADVTSEVTLTSSSAATGSISTAAFEATDSVTRLNVLTSNWARGFFYDEARFGYDLSSVAGPPVAQDDADFDGDGDVDVSDVLTYQRGFGVGTTQPEGDADGDGVVDADDLAVIESQFGTGDAVAAISAVPEPASLLLVLCGLGACGLRRR